MRLDILSFILVFFVQCCHSARILGVFPLAGKSLNILYNRLMRGLADAGHDVTVISAYTNKLPVKNGSITDVLLTGFAEEYDLMLSQESFLDSPEDYPFYTVLYYLELLEPTWNSTLHHPNVQKLLSSNQKFDLVITEHFWSDCLKIFAHIYNCPLVIFTSMGGINSWVNDQVGNLLLPSYVTHTMKLRVSSEETNFRERAHNLLFYITDYVYKHYFLFPNSNAMLKGAFSNPPDIADIYDNVSLVLLGSHSSLRPAAPLSPNTVEIGGFHIDPPKKLPKDLQEIMDNAKNGVIYFSMGSQLRSKDFSEEKKKIFLDVFARLEQTVLWKFEDETLPGKSSNVYIRKWLPPVDLLAHPNMKLFITHGGYGSLQETIYHGVPVLAISVVADQHNNAFQAVQLGFGLKLSYNDKNFSEKNLFNKIIELLDNPKYRENAQARSRIFHDRPMKPLDTAVYWIEYVIRNKGAEHLRLLSTKLPWYKLYCMDIFVAFFISLWVLYKLLCVLLLKVFGKNQEKLKVKEN
ncbi:UDP-glucuronosyltransferase 2B15-like [Sitophilus oryzae]|uniref:UDP-glucuronosyltransferase 2B15-like n=1 Tax=Sitophilus oryzae TaxID=7048 RepID=A0A6J2X609_SITOR|nr:UDP-glucuronosyltransferase 2B15-like [Sitophilus oryzae]